VLTKRLAGDPLELVAIHGAFRDSTRDGETEARGVAIALASEHGEEAISRTRGLGEDSPELCGRVQSLVGGKPCRVGEQRRARSNLLRRKARAAFRAPTCENLSSGAGRHAGAESVRALAVQIAGLKSSLHDRIPRTGKSTWETRVWDGREAAHCTRRVVRLSTAVTRVERGR